MKRILIISLALILMLTSCNKLPSSSQSSVEQGEDSGILNKENSAENTGETIMLTNKYGGGGWTGFGTTNGYYNQHVTNYGYNLSYLDYETKKMVYLCNRLECTHSDSTCTAFLEVQGELNIFLDKAEENLFLLCVGNSDVNDDYENRRGKIIKMDKNGENSSVIYQLGSKEVFDGNIARDDKNLYIAVKYINKKDNTVKEELRRISLQDGTATVVCQLANSQRVCGAFENNVVLESFQNEMLKFSCVNVNTGEQKQAYSRPFSDSRLEKVCGEVAVIIRCTHETSPTAQLALLNLKTGEEEQICNIDIYGTDITYFYTERGDVLPIMVIDNSDINNIKRYFYNFDLKTKELNVCTLTYKRFQDEISVTVIAENETQFLVVNGSEKGDKKPVTSNDGSLYQVDTENTKFALISKEDYKNNIPNYFQIDLVDVG